MSAGSLPEGIVPSGTPERDNDSLYGTPKEEVGPNAQAIHFQGNRERVCDTEYMSPWQKRLLVLGKFA